MNLKMRISVGVLIVVLLMSTVCTPVAANSAIREWAGSTAHGVVSGDGQCPIGVLHETLTFDIPHFPNGEYERYAAKVTAEYTLQNPSQQDVTVKLAFPFGQRPSYPYFNEEDIDESKYGVWLNGEPVEVQLRHTYHYGQFNLQTDLPKLCDAYLEHEFYSKELPVTHYVYEVHKAKETKNANAWAELLIDKSLGDSTRLLVPDSVLLCDAAGDIIRVNVSPGEARQLIDVYVLGAAIETMPAWRLQYSNSALPFDGEVNLISTDTMTYYELAMLDYEGHESIAEQDWYNAITESFIAFEWKHRIIPTHYEGLDISEFLMQWYEYEITVGAGQTVQNSVTAPIFPGVSERYEPPIYSYTYLLSPATTWASFGTLDVIINTPHYLVQDTYGYEKIEGGYQKHYDSLPTGELSFKLSSDENPKNVGAPNFAGMLFGFLAILFGSFFIGIVGIILAIVIAILILVAIVRAIRRRHKYY